MQGLSRIFWGFFFRNERNKFKNTGERLLGSFYRMTIKGV